MLYNVCMHVCMYRLSRHTLSEIQVKLSIQYQYLSLIIQLSMLCKLIKNKKVTFIVNVSKRNTIWWFPIPKSQRINNIWTFCCYTDSRQYSLFLFCNKERHAWRMRIMQPLETPAACYTGSPAGAWPVAKKTNIQGTKDYLLYPHSSYVTEIVDLYSTVRAPRPYLLV